MPYNDHPASEQAATTTKTTQKRLHALSRRKPNAEHRPREHLTEREVEKLIEAVKGNRWGNRDATMVLLAAG
jgi:hypothetical protein